MKQPTLKEIADKRAEYEARAEQVFVDSIDEHGRQIFSLAVLRLAIKKAGALDADTTQLIDEMLRGAHDIIERAKKL